MDNTGAGSFFGVPAAAYQNPCLFINAGSLIASLLLRVALFGNLCRTSSSAAIAALRSWRSMPSALRLLAALARLRWQAAYRWLLERHEQLGHGYARVDCARFAACSAGLSRIPDQSRHSAHVTECRDLVGIISRVRRLAVERAQCTTSSSVVSDDDMHKLPASRDERADGGHGSESLR